MKGAAPVERGRLMALVDAIAGCRVAIAGDVIADEFIYGEIARVSREAPVLILNYDSTEVVPGGAGNAAGNVAALGGDARLAGVIGRDEAGRRLLATLKRRGVDAGAIVDYMRANPVEFYDKTTFDNLEPLTGVLGFKTLWKAASLPIPATRILRSDADAEAAAQALPYPAVLKPALKTREWTAATRAKAIRVDDGPGLVAAWRTWSGPAGVMIAQTWIEGGESSLVSANAYLDREGRTRVMFTARKLRQWPPETGTSCLGEEVRDEHVADVATRLFEGAGYRGLAYLEMKRDDRSGEALIVEPNLGRPTGRSG